MRARRFRRLAGVSGVSLLLAVVSVHYLEVSLLPLVGVLRVSIYGEQSYTSALSGCEAVSEGAEWVHPTTLALTVYGDTQRALAQRLGAHGPEVLPDYLIPAQGREELRCVADYFLRAGERRNIDGTIVRVYPFAVAQRRYGLAEGWVSGLTQGMVGQTLLAAYFNEGDKEYLAAAQEAGRLLDIDIADGGVRVALANGAVWYEEYAQSGKSPALVLNGHLLALDFLYWMSQFEPDQRWDEMFESGVRAVVDQIGHFLGAFWSYYDQQDTLATRKYHAFHVRQLSRYMLHDSTGVLTRARNSMRWQLYVPLGVFQRLLEQPSRLLVFEVALLLVLYWPGIWLISARRRA